MSQNLNGLIGGLTRRHALKAGAGVVSGLVGGRAAVGTVSASESISVRASAFHHRVRAADDEEPSPKPDPQDLLVERAQGNPVDDGEEANEIDGTHQLRWGEFRAVQGRAKIECVDGGTDVTVKYAGLVPGQLYSVWVTVFEDPGFIDTRDLSKATENRVGLGSLGAPDGSENVFRARGGTGRLEVFHPNGDLSLFGSVDDCLLNEFEVHLVGIFHLDDETHGPAPEMPPGSGTVAPQVAFEFGTGV